MIRFTPKRRFRIVSGGVRRWLMVAPLLLVSLRSRRDILRLGSSIVCLEGCSEATPLYDYLNLILIPKSR